MPAVRHTSAAYTDFAYWALPCFVLTTAHKVESVEIGSFDRFTVQLGIGMDVLAQGSTV